ncbi:MAG: glycosyltransferase family 2 protein [Mycobacteriales bacterium]
MPDRDGEAKEGPAATVTTVLYNSEASLPRYAQALAPSLDRGVVRLIAVDNASPDGSASLLRELVPAAEIIGNPTNLGFAAGCNRAWPSVRSRYWMLVNPDVEADPAGIERLVRWMDTHPEVGLATPRLRLPDGREVPVARPHDSLWRPILEALRLHRLVPQSLRARWLLSGRHSTPELIDGWVPGAALMARSEAVVAAGPLDESLFMYGEDREWCWRMARSGWAIGVCHEVEFVHGRGTSASATWDEPERIGREVRGHLKAARRLRGQRWARAFALLAGVVLLAESLHPRRAEDVRTVRRMRGRLYLHAARTRIP